MRDLPRLARLYLILTWVLSASIIGQAIIQFSGDYRQWWLLLAGLCAFILADYHEVNFETNDGQTVSTNMTEAPILFMVVASGLPGVLAIALGSLINETLKKRPWYARLFNSSQHVLSYTAMLLTYGLFPALEATAFNTPLGLVAFVSVAVIGYLVNGFILCLIIALSTGEPVMQVYRESLRSFNWVHVITFSMGALLVVLWFDAPWMLPLGILPLFMAQRAFVAVAGWQVEGRRNRELAAERAGLLEELKVKQEELVQAAKFASLGTFASGIAHEFNNLLAAILGHAQLGLSTDDVAEKDMSLSVALRACQRGRSITSSLLTFARRREVQFGYHQVLDAVEDTLTMVEHELRKGNIVVERDFEPVPPTMCDLGQLVQVVMNLVTNARDAMPQGGTLNITLRQQNDQIELAVADTGMGIPEDVRDKVFQPFVTTKGPGKGTGLGLAMCYGIIEGHNGSITIDSVVGRGTTMTIHLPITGSDQQIDEKPPQMFTSLRILVVDDEPDVISALVGLLERSGHKVQTASDAESALRVYRPRAFDVVLSDAVMPGISGARFIQRLRSIDAHVPILVITGQPGLPQVNAMLEAGANEVLGKPFVLEEVTEALSQVIRMRAISAT